MDSTQPVIYSVTVTGHEAPFKWRLQKRHGETGTRQAVKIKDMVLEPSISGGNTLKEKLVDAEGESYSFDQALLDAREAAVAAEWERQHATTTYCEDIMRVEQHGDPRGSDEEPADQPTKNYGRAGGTLTPTGKSGPEEER